MLSPPSFISDQKIAKAVGAHWLAEPVDVVYLPRGFGAHHWRATGGSTSLFVTLDQLAPRHSASSLEVAYASAADLAAAGVDLVCAPLPSRSGRFTVDVGAGALSVTPWLAGRTPTAEEASRPEHISKVLDGLSGLHCASPPSGLRPWVPRVNVGFAEELRARTARPWTSGPLAEKARAALASHCDAIELWTDRYLGLADLALARRDRWVPTHGEPHKDNQIVEAGVLRLVDWETLALAPPERDYANLLGSAARDDLAPDPAMVELFALEWPLSEVVEYADRFAAPHNGTEDDHAALEDLHQELARAAG